MKLIIRSTFLLLFIASFSFSQNDRLQEARELIEQRKFDLAKPILEFLYEEDNENPDLNYWYGVYCLMQNNYDDAIDYLDVAIEGNKNNAVYYNMLGNAYGMKARNAGALKAAFAAPKAKSNWEKAVELKPDYLDAKQALFQYYLQAPGIMGGDYNKAKELADQFVKTHPNLGHLYLANYFLVAEENIEKANEELQKSMQVDSSDTLYDRINRGNANLLNAIGYHYLNNKDFSKSKKAFTQAIDLLPNNANPYDSMGDYYVAIAKYDSALICFDNALKKDSKFVASKYNKGKMLENLNRKDEAIMVYKELIKESPDSRYAEDAEDRLDELE
jgi:tetratricopeptide (TPR) repeat protein